MAANYGPKLSASPKVSVKLPDITKTAKANLRRKLFTMKRRKLGTEAPPTLGSKA